MFDKKDCLYAVLCFFKGRGLVVSKLLLQKSMYALDFVKVPMGLEFEAYTYGPFCREISAILDRMEIDGIVRVEGKNIELGADDSISHPEISEEERTYIGNILEQFVEIIPDGDTSSFDMVELFGTVMYVMDVLDLEESENGESTACATTPPPPFEKALEEVRRWKQDKFREDQIDEAYRRIADTLWKARLQAA